MAFVIEDFLWLDILEYVYSKWAPNTELDHVLTKVYLSILTKEDKGSLPPERVRLIVRRYIEFPEYYSMYAARQFLHLPADSDLAIAMANENDWIFQRLGTVPALLGYTTRFPLPEWEFLNQAVLDEVLYTFSRQLDFNVSLYPVNPSIDFESYWVAVSMVVPRLLAAYYIDQLTKAVGLAPTP